MRGSSDSGGGHAFVLDTYEYLSSVMVVKLLVLEDAPHPITPNLYHEVYNTEISPYFRTTYHLNMGWNS